MNVKKEYEYWLTNAKADADIVAELEIMDDAKIEDAFYRNLAFGTGGLRGVIGAGTNRMNIYTVAKASQGLADYLKKKFVKPSVAIGYDSRIKSDVFAKVAASVFVAKLLFTSQNKSLLARADKIIATSPNYIEGSKWLQSVKTKCIVIPNCINVERMEITQEIEKKVLNIRAQNKNKTICVAVGRHTEYKGFSYLIQASKFLDDSFHIYITGTGELTEKLHEEARGDKKITFTGRIDDDELKSLILASDLFCFPSITKNEAFGLALAEGMYYEKPAITFSIQGSGVNYVSLDKVTGIEVENRNVKKYADAMRLLAQNEELRVKYGKAGKKRIEENFLSTQFTKNIRNMFKSIL